jgi:hypothetical protein
MAARFINTGGANMDDVIKILIDNLHECSRQAQRFIVQSIGSALLLLILTTRGGGLFKLPIVDQEVDPFLATFIFMVACIILTTMAISTVNQVRIICSQLERTNNDGRKNIVDAAITYPSIITSKNRFMKVGAAILPSLLLTASYIVESQRPGNSTALSALIGLAVLSIPFFFLAYKLYEPLLKDQKEAVST